MAFTRTNLTQLTALKNEITIDPISMGYAGLSNKQIAALLNDEAGNLAPANGNAPVTSEKLLDVIFDEAISSQDQFKIQLVFEGSNGFGADLSRFKAKIGGLSTGLGTAVNTIVRPLSRAEVLFAVDGDYGIKEFVTISDTDVRATGDI